MKLIHLKEHLQAHEIRLKKSLSQNFLIDQNIRRKILAAAEVKKSDFVLEIGPGSGAITEALVQTGAQVVAIEKDTHFAHQLTQKQHSNLQVILADFLTYPLEKIIPPDRKIKVVSNIPYQITSRILGKLMPLGEKIDSITLMVQDEVAKRIVATEGCKTYGRISIFCQYYSQPTYLFSVSPHCFFPKPKVHSAVIQFKPYSKRFLSSIEEEKSFFTMIQKAFQTRRKTLFNCLKQTYEGLENIGILKTTRAESISLQDFLRLFLQIHRPTPKINAR